MRRSRPHDPPRGRFCGSNGGRRCIGFRWPRGMATRTSRARRLKHTFIKVTLGCLLSRAPLDFVHSFICFQHIPPHRRAGDSESAVDLLHDDGIGVLPSRAPVKRDRVRAAPSDSTYKSVPSRYWASDLLREARAEPMNADEPLRMWTRF